jgi:hypothetical protein
LHGTKREAQAVLTKLLRDRDTDRLTLPSWQIVIMAECWS